jgi:hypothetical protein
MAEISLLVGSLLIISGILFLLLSYEIPYSILLPYWFASGLVLASGTLFIIKYKDRKLSVFVCGDCNRHFLNELDLRQHYVNEHVKKDSGDKKD